MPESSELLEEGRRYEGHGVLDRALESYVRAAEDASDPAVVAEALTHQSRVHRCRSEWELALATARKAQETARAAWHDSCVAGVAVCCRAAAHRVIIMSFIFVPLFDIVKTQAAPTGWKQVRSPHTRG